MIRIGVELLLGQAAGHVGAGVVVVEIEGEIILIGRRPVGLEDHIVDIVAAVAVAVPVAIDPGIQQRHANAIVRGATDKGIVDMFPTPVGRGLQGGADFTGKSLGNRPGHEVDHPTDVLRSITHGAGATYHVDTLQVAG